MPLGMPPKNKKKFGNMGLLPGVGFVTFRLLKDYHIFRDS